MLAYTDGACSGNPGPGAWGAIIIFDETGDDFQISGYNPDTTNNRMELQAVVEVLQLAADLDQEVVTICSDSAYVVNAVNKGWLDKWAEEGWKTRVGEEVKNKDLWLRLLKLSKLVGLDIIKVVGHSGDSLNEKADQIAREELRANRK